MFKRLRFNWKAQTGHGLHSPFVYKLYTEVIDVIYQQSPSNLQHALIHGIGAHLKLKEGQLHLIDLTKITEADMSGIEALFSQPDHVVICLNPHTNDNTHSLWQRLYQNPCVIHSIELFEMGILSLKPTAPKQHFWLKKS
jgi:hypothetical protein